MSYVVLARKWRPMVFDDVVAQNHITKTLKNAITSKRIASAYLFSGPRGVGKTTTARILAKAINCDEGPTATPCNSCISCKEIKDGRSLDVFEIDGASNRGIDEVRNLRENLRYAASKGKYKIYIIDEVHMLTPEAFNALLKTLEEPPARVLFIFATTEPHKVPATILSRCQRFDFRRIPVSHIVQKLRSICNAENIKIDDESLNLIARKSEGALRDSQSLLDQVVSFCGPAIEVTALSELLGIIDQDVYFKCTDCIVEKNVAGGLNFAEKVFNQGYDIAELLNGLAEHFRNILVIKTTNNIALLEGLESYSERYSQVAQMFSETDALRLIQTATDAANQIKRSANPKLLLEMLLVKMIKMDKSVELETLLSNLNNAPADSSKQDAQPPKSVDMNPKTQAQSQFTRIRQITPNIQTQIPSAAFKPELPEREVAPKPDPVDSMVSLEKIKTEWDGVVEAVKQQRIHLGSFMNEGYPTAVRSGILEVAFAKENAFHVKTINQNKGDIEKIIEQHTGFRLKLDCYQHHDEDFKKILEQMKKNPLAEQTNPAVILEETDTEPDKKADDVDRPAVESDFMNIPMVKQIIEMFDGEVVEHLRKDDKLGDR